MVIGSNRHLFKELLDYNRIPTPEYKFIKDLRSNTPHYSRKQGCERMRPHPCFRATLDNFVID
jgi:hypothetical protein